MTDPRRASAIRAELRRLAPALVPGWAPVDGGGDFGAALLEIAARLVEETTSRLDRTAQRDAIAFFDLLGLPPTPPRAASGVLIMALAESQAIPILAPARVQVVASRPGGEEVTFESQHALRVVPGRIAELITVDRSTDRIELAPAPVTSLEAPLGLPSSYEVVTFAGNDGNVLQLSPAIGLAPDDLLRVGPTVYRISEVKDDLVSLRDPLEAAVPARTIISRIDSLSSYALRDLQRHAVYIGHAELLNLKQPAEISIDLAPVHLAGELTGLDIAYTLYGTIDGEDEPAWHPLQLLGTAGSALLLAKTWTGSVDEVEVGGHKSRWVRAELGGPLVAPASLTAPVSQVCLTVASLEVGEPGTATGEAAGGQQGSVVALVEGSQTIAQAFHNGAPLSTARRFYPFGAEPLRFDVFAVAAPEALSKKGAKVSLVIDMIDSSLASFAITAANGAIDTGGYGVGRNGYLQVVVFEADGSPRWLELEPVAEGGQRLLLDGTGMLGSVGAGTATNIDLVVVADRDGGLRSARVQWPTTQRTTPSIEPSEWRSLPARSQGASRPVLVATPAGADGASAVLFDVDDGLLYSLAIDDQGQPDSAGWRPVVVDGFPGPAFGDRWRLTEVLGPEWPRRPDGREIEVVVIDDDGAVWLGRSEPIEAGDPLTVRWYRLDEDEDGREYLASADVCPTASRFEPLEGSPRLWVSYARSVDDQPQDRTDGEEQAAILHGLVRTGGQNIHFPLDDRPEAAVLPGSALHANPSVLGEVGHPVTAAIGAGGQVAVVWFGAGALTASSIPGATSVPQPLLVDPGATGPELVVTGAGESLLHAAIDAPRYVGYELHNGLGLESPQNAHLIEITDDPTDPSASTTVELSNSNRRMVDGDLRIYQVDDPALEVGQTLRYIRRVEPNGPVYSATFADPDDRTQLRLDDEDEATTDTMQLLIDDASYVIEELSNDRVATLAEPVTGTDAPPGYRPVRVLGSATVQASDLATLAELDGEALGDADRLDFGPGTDPRTQLLANRQASGNTVWARLGEAWRSVPDADGLALVPNSNQQPSWTVSTLQRGYQNPELSWEYYDGEGWRRLEKGFLDGTANLSTSGEVKFIVPADLATTELGGKEDHWIRARLVGGDYGRPNYVVRTEVDPTDDDVTIQNVTVDATGLRPPEIASIETTFRLTELAYPELVLAENNLAVLDQTEAASAPEARFDFFLGATAVDVEAPDRALYVGLTAPIGEGPVVILVDAADQDGSGSLRADLRTPDGWRPVIADDRTESLRRRGTIALTLDVEPVMVRLFGRERVWLRLRPGNDGGDPAPWAPVIHGLRLNAVEIRQARTVQNEILGSSLGEPNMTVELAEHPVLPDTVVLRVRERLGDEERAALEAEQQRVAQPGGEPDTEPVVLSDVELVPGSWVRWRRVDSLVGLDGDARAFLLDPQSGLVTFGDGRAGRIPPAGRDGICAFSYQHGGGEAGNLPAWSEARLRSAVEGVETAVLPIDTAGGFGGPGADALFATAPDRLRHAGLAMTPADIEALAVSSTTDVVGARCVPPTGPGEPIRITIAVRDGSRCPVPTLAQRDAVAAFVRESGWGGLADDSVEVDGPVYVGISVAVRLTAGRDLLADVEQAAESVLADLLHPIDGGPLGQGWPFGLAPTSSDVLRALAAVAGIDRVESIDIDPIGAHPLSPMPADGLVCAETTDINVVVIPVEEAR